MSKWKPACNKIKFFHLDALGIFLDVLEHGYRKKHEDETFKRITAVLQKARDYGCSTVSFFTWLSDLKREHKNLNRRTPWKWSKLSSVKPIKWGKINFTRESPRYNELADRFMRTVSECRMEAMPQAHMARYCFPPFELKKNKNRFNGFFDPCAFQVEVDHILKWIILQKSYGMNPWISPINELGHFNDETGHRNAEWFKAVWLACQDLMEMKRFAVDITESEYCLAQLVDHKTGHPTCPKCGRRWDNNPLYDRTVLPVQHNCTMIDDLERKEGRYEHAFGVFIRNLYNWHLKMSEDGARYGSITPIEGLPWKYGSPDQIYEMLFYAWTRCMKAPRKKHFYWGLYPMECVSQKDGVFNDYYDVDIINWSRFEAAQIAQNDVFKEA
jgi:hypothetical protein